MDAACCITAKGLRFRTPRISRSIAVIVLALAFHSEDPNRVGDAVNVFLFPDLSLLACSEAALLARRWDAVFGGGTLTSFVDTSLLLGHHKVAPVESLDKAASQLKVWAVFCTLFLGTEYTHPATTKMMAPVKETTCIQARLPSQCRRPPILPVALLRLIQTEYKESFRQYLEQQHRVAWPNFDGLKRGLATGIFRLEMFTVPGYLLPVHKTARIPAQPPASKQTAPPRETQHTQCRRIQSQEQNPWPTPAIQVAEGFRLSKAIDMASDVGVEILATDDVRHFCFCCHLKGMCNSHCGGHHSHITLSQGESTRMMEWRDRLCGADAQPLVEEISTPAGTVVSHASSLSVRIRRTRGTRGGCNQW